MGGVRTCKLLLFLTCFLSICSSSRATFCTCVLVLLVQKYIYRQVSICRAFAPTMPPPSASVYVLLYQ
jgi:hypothetical protein